MAVAFDLFANASGGWQVEADCALPSGLLPVGASPLSADVGSPQMPSRSDAARLLFEDGLPTPYAGRLTAQSTLSLLAFMYRPKAREEMLAFERRIEPRYQTFYAERGILYAGVFDIPQVEGPYLGEVLFFASDRATAQHLMDTTDPPEDILEIEEECRALQDRDQPRYRFWLTR
jgi:hypothetical protein